MICSSDTLNAGSGGHHTLIFQGFLPLSLRGRLLGGIRRDIPCMVYVIIKYYVSRSWWTWRACNLFGNWRHLYQMSYPSDLSNLLVLSKL